jgi:hypothetical protein
VVKEIKFLVCEKIDRNWVANQHRLLEVKTRASRDAQLEFRSGSFDFNRYLNIHDLSVPDPFPYSFDNGDKVNI